MRINYNWLKQNIKDCFEENSTLISYDQLQDTVKNKIDNAINRAYSEIHHLQSLGVADDEDYKKLLWSLYDICNRFHLNCPDNLITELDDIRMYEIEANHMDYKDDYEDEDGFI